MKEAKRICFLGKGGIGKSVITANVSAALAKSGARVLQVGNDISLSSTLLLRKSAEITPALEEYRKNYVIKIADYIVPTESGVYCLELGSLEPGVGCMARGINIIDEMLEHQGVIEALALDFILYDIAGDTPCTGYILPMRDGVMHECIVVADNSFPGFATANSIVAGIARARRDHTLSVALLVNFADRYPAKAQLDAYAREISAEVVGYLDYDLKIEYSELAGQTVLEAYPDSAAAAFFDTLAKRLSGTAMRAAAPVPLEREQLLQWLQHWKQRSLAQKSGIIGIDDSRNI